MYRSMQQRVSLTEVVNEESLPSISTGLGHLSTGLPHLRPQADLVLARAASTLSHISVMMRLEQEVSR